MLVHIVMIVVLIAVVGAVAANAYWPRKGQLTAARSIAVAAVGVSAVTFTAMYWLT